MLKNKEKNLGFLAQILTYTFYFSSCRGLIRPAEHNKEFELISYVIMDNNKLFIDIREISYPPQTLYHEDLYPL